MLAELVILTEKCFLFQADMSSKEVDITEVPYMGNSPLGARPSQ